MGERQLEQDRVNVFLHISGPRGILLQPFKRSGSSRCFDPYFPGSHLFIVQTLLSVSPLSRNFSLLAAVSAESQGQQTKVSVCKSPSHADYPLVKRFEPFTLVCGFKALLNGSWSQGYLCNLSCHYRNSAF